MRVTHRITAAAANPVFFGILPNSGPIAGGQSVQVAASGIEAGAIITFGGINATSVVVVSSSVLTAITPAGIAGSTNVIIENPDGGTSGTSGNGAYTYGGNPMSMGTGKFQQIMLDGDQVITLAEVANNAIIEAIGVMSAERTLTFPAPATIATDYVLSVKNSCTGGQNLKVTTGAGTFVEISPGGTVILTFDTTGVWEAVTVI